MEMKKNILHFPNPGNLQLVESMWIFPFTAENLQMNLYLVHIRNILVTKKSN